MTMLMIVGKWYVIYNIARSDMKSGVMTVEIV